MMEDDGLGMWRISGVRRLNPKGNLAIITMVASPAAKDVSVVTAPDGQHFTVTVPTLVEPAQWDSKI